MKGAPWWACWVVAVGSACIEAESYRPTLVVAVQPETVAAGQPVAWTARLVDGQTESAAVTVAFESDLEPELAFSGRELYPRVAGTHALTARASVDGEYLEASLALDVAAAPAQHLEVTLAESPSVAGATVALLARATGAFGNAVNVGNLLLDADPAVQIGDGVVSATEAGSWSITAQLDEQVVTVPFEVVPGAPDAIALTVETFTDTVTTTVRVTDEYDNPVRVSTELSVDGVEHVVLGSVIYFLGEGTAEIVAVEPTSGLASAPITVTADWSAPVLTIDSPERGAWLSVGTVDFTGTATDAVSNPVVLEVDGAAVTLADGVWSHPIPLAFGMTVVETLAFDAAGHRARDLRAVVAGALRVLGETEPDGMLVRLDEDPAGLGVVERMAEEALEGLDLAKEDDNPVYSDAEKTCRTQLGVTVCVWTRLTVELDQIAYESVDVELDGQSTGLLDATVTLGDVDVDWAGSGMLSDAPFSDSGRGTASQMVVMFDLAFAVVDQAVEVTASNVAVELVDFDLGASADTVAAAAALGVDLNALVGEVVERAAAGVLPGIVEDAIEGAFADLNVTLGWPQGSVLVSRPTEVQVDETGLALQFGTVTTLDTWALDGPERGALVRSTNRPSWTHTEPAAMALSLNTLNQIFHANWGGGFLDVDGGPEVFDIDMAVFTAALPGIRTLVGTVRATYPPLFVPDAAGQLRMELPELRVDFYDGEIVEGESVYAIFLTVSTPVDVALSDNRLDLIWGEQEVWMDIERAPQDADLFFLEALLESFSAGLVLNDYELVDALPLPSIGDSELEGVAVGFFGPDEAYLVIDGRFHDD